MANDTEKTGTPLFEKGLNIQMQSLRYDHRGERHLL